jgi:hypothetical protein
MSDQDTTSKDKEKKPPEWEKRKFAINESMKQVCELAIAATQAEITSLKRKLEKLQYGS